MFSAEISYTFKVFGEVPI